MGTTGSDNKRQALKSLTEITFQGDGEYINKEKTRSVNEQRANAHAPVTVPSQQASALAAASSDKTNTIIFYGRIKRFWNVDNDKPDSVRWLERLLLLEKVHDKYTIKAYKTPKDWFWMLTKNITEFNTSELAKLTLSKRLEEITVVDQKKDYKPHNNCVKNSKSSNKGNRLKEYADNGFAVQGSNLKKVC